LPTLLPARSSRGLHHPDLDLSQRHNSIFRAFLRYPIHSAISSSERTREYKGDQSPVIGTAKSTFHAEIEATKLANSCQRSALHPPPSHLSSRSRPWQPHQQTAATSSRHRRPALLHPQRRTSKGRLDTVFLIADSYRCLVRPTQSVLSFFDDAAIVHLPHPVAANPTEAIRRFW